MLVIDPGFWVAALGWSPGCAAFFGIRTLGRRLEFGIAVFIFAEVPRTSFPSLAFRYAAPRIDTNPSLLVWIGVLVLAGSLFFGTPGFRIIPLRAPDQREPLSLGRRYSIVRPLMLCDIFWPLGWSLIFGSVIGVLLTPVWPLVIWAGTYLEEKSLVREYGEAYAGFSHAFHACCPPSWLRTIAS